jgi:hypothetical protein
MLTDYQMKRWGEVVEVLAGFDLEHHDAPPDINQIIARMEKGGYNVSTESSARVFGKTLYSVKFFRGEEVIHATGSDLLACYQQALKEAHRRYREKLPT